MRKLISFIGAVLLSVSTLSISAQAEEAHQLEILSLNPYGAFLEEGAYFTGFINGRAPLRLPAEGRPVFTIGFTVPDHYDPRFPLLLVLLAESESRLCDFQLTTNGLLRMRDGEERDFGLASGGFFPLDASTCIGPCFFPFANNFTMVFPTGSPALHTNFEIRFRIHGGPADEWTNFLQPGDGIILSIFREGNGTFDSCTLDLAIGGISVVYPTM